jgi:hypothetical protein
MSSRRFTRFGNRVAHGVVAKTYSVTHLNVNEAARRYSPAAVIAVARDVVSGIPAEISTSYVERQNLSAIQWRYGGVLCLQALRRHLLLLQPDETFVYCAFASSESADDEE